MAYQALYRKYRPQLFADVLGQEHITTTLKNQVESGRVSHAYVFSGSRGTGKTTTAKILARAVNCAHPVNGEPCGECEYCLAAADSADIIELDAASNNGVDDVRAIIDKARFTPLKLKKKVYIIDEAHMLSRPAGGAAGACAVHIGHDRAAKHTRDDTFPLPAVRFSPHRRGGHNKLRAQRR